ncbi:amidase [Devosia sp. A369]
MSEIADIYDQLDATGMAELVRSGAVEPDAFVKEAQRRIAERNPSINAVVHQFPAQMSAMPRQGAFAGVPLLLKDIGIAVRDTPMSCGSALMRNQVCVADNTLAARYRAAGFAFIGRTSTAEFALSFTSEPELFGPCRNPWDLALSAGGSSGGAAAVVAAGIVPVAQCSDGAGSTRVPAAHCGLFGFKPTRIRNPLGPLLAEGSAGMSTPHAVTRTVRDSALMLAVSSGPDIGDPYAAPPPARPFLDAFGEPPRHLRIGVLASSEFGAVDDFCKLAVESAASLCSELGHIVEPAYVQMDQALLKQAWFTVSAVGVTQWIDQYAQAHSIAHPEDSIEPINQQWIEAGRAISGVTYLDAVQVLHRSSRALGQFFQKYDLLMSPTTAETARPIGDMAGAGINLDDFFNRFWRHSPFTAIFNASGCPAMSVPLYRTAGGLPVGVQFGAPLGADELLFSFAGQLEQARPWPASVRSARY